MPGYLDQYGAGDERRARIIKQTAISVVVLAALGGLLYAFFHNYRQEHQVTRFFAQLAAHDYKGAYALWGCTEAKPCRDYSMPAFLQDWGPQSVPAGDFTVLDGESCGSGVIVDVDAGKGGDKKLWVERGNLLIGYPPFDQCPYRNRISDFFRDIKYRMHGRVYK
jgi:hypothetical protein